MNKIPKQARIILLVLVLLPRNKHYEPKERTMYSVLPETKLMKQAEKMTVICDCLEQIKDDYVNGIDISYSELAFLYEHQDIIKKIYTDDPTLWELAGIDESEWTNRHNKGSK